MIISGTRLLLLRRAQGEVEFRVALTTSRRWSRALTDSLSKAKSDDGKKEYVSRFPFSVGESAGRDVIL
jgi:hypothetical protein